MSTSRALLLADDGERRALERRLHDGVQQQLVALAVDVQLARGLVEADPQAAARLLDEVRNRIGRALDEVRDVAALVHPALLDAQGLVAALRTAAAAAPVPTRIEGTVEDGPAAEVAVTVYRCCVAALSGTGGTGATVAVRTRSGVLEFEVELAGGHVDAGALAALAGRVDVLGGELEIGPSRVAGRLPVMPASRPLPGT